MARVIIAGAWSRRQLLVALAGNIAAGCAYTGTAPDPPAPPQSAGLQNPPAVDLPANPEPEYFAAVSAWSTVVRHPPIATIALDAAASIVASVTADPTPVQVDWNFDDGDNGRFRTTSSRVMYQYRSRGWKTIHVTIEDARGRRASNIVQVLLVDYPREWY